MSSYDIGYAIGSMIPFVVLAAIAGIIIYLAIRRSNEKHNETFEDRDN